MPAAWPHSVPCENCPQDRAVSHRSASHSLTGNTRVCTSFLVWKDIRLAVFLGDEEKGVVGRGGFLGHPLLPEARLHDEQLEERRPQPHHLEEVVFLEDPR